MSVDDPSDPFGLDTERAAPPAGSRIVFTPGPTGGRFTRPPPRHRDLWREVLLPAGVLAVIGAGLVVVAGAAFGLGSRPNATAQPNRLLFGVLFAGGILWFYILWETIQNGGIVTKIEIADG